MKLSINQKFGFIILLYVFVVASIVLRTTNFLQSSFLGGLNIGDQISLFVSTLSLLLITRKFLNDRKIEESNY